MLDITVADVLTSTSATLVCGPKDLQVQAVEIDSRRVVPATLLVCFPGERQDGNDFAASAFASGAAAVVMTRKPEDVVIAAARKAGAALLRAENDDPTEFMLRLARAWRLRNPQWCVVGVTGSVGKTTTKDFLAAGLGACWKTHATAGNFNNLLGVPLTLLSANANDEVVVCEMGMNHLGELSRLTQVVRPSVAIITNVGTAHIGLLGSRKNIARAKAEIIEGMAPSAQIQRLAIGAVQSCMVLTADNDFASFIEDSFARPAEVDVLYVSTEADRGVAGTYSDASARKQDSAASSMQHAASSVDHLQLSAGVVSLDELGRPSFDLHFFDGSSRHVRLEVPGEAVVADFVLAVAVAERLGASRDVVLAAMEQMPSSHMRLEVVGGGDKPRVIDDSYNASPSSMAAALDVLAALPAKGRRIAVLGEMGEMGAESARLHEYVGAYAAATKPDLIVWVGTADAAHMREAALVMGFSEDRMESFSDVSTALATIGPILHADDVILVKASRAAGLDAFVKGVLASC